MKKSTIKKVLLTLMVMLSIMLTTVPTFAVDEVETGTVNKIEEVNEFNINGMKIAGKTDNVVKSDGTVLSAFDTWMVEHNCTYYKTHTTSLYDTSAIYMAVTGDYNVVMEDHMLSIDDGGYTNDDEAGRLVHCAVYWKYKDIFYKFITDRLCNN